MESVKVSYTQTTEIYDVLTEIHDSDVIDAGIQQEAYCLCGQFIDVPFCMVHFYIKSILFAKNCRAKK